MKLEAAKTELGIVGIRRVSEHTVTVVINEKHCYPASALEIRMWELIKRLCND